MANLWPSGTPVKNTGHAQQAYLVAAFVPRSTSQILECVSATNVTLAQNGTSYDSDGFWFGYAASRQTNTFTLQPALDGKGPLTLIVGLKRHASNNPTGNNSVGLWGATVGLEPYMYLRMDQYNANVLAEARDASSNSLIFGTGDGMFSSTGYRVIGFANDQNGGGSALAIERLPGSSTPETASDTGIDHYGTGNLSQFGMSWDHGWGINFVFVYSGIAMTQGQMEAIADDPGAVVSFEAGAGQPFGKRLGGVPFATSSRGVW